jgi:uncharacterized protein YgiB involved in biofilm formation
MKKSKAIRLVLLGGTGLTLAACDEPPPNDARFFASLDECTAVHSQAVCEDALGKSAQTHLAEAPRFAAKEQCEAEFGAGNCETRGEGMGSYFLPMMMGYMLGNAFSRPVYRGPDGGAFTRSGGKFYNVGNFAAAGRGAPFQAGQIAQVQRGGFGSTASAFRSSAGT